MRCERRVCSFVAWLLLFTFFYVCTYLYTLDEKLANFMDHWDINQVEYIRSLHRCTLNVNFRTGNYSNFIAFVPWNKEKIEQLDLTYFLSKIIVYAMFVM